MNSRKEFRVECKKVFFLEGFRGYNLLDGVGCFFAVHFPHPKFLTLKAAI